MIIKNMINFLFFNGFIKYAKIMRERLNWLGLLDLEWKVWKMTDLIPI